jgi:LmbE family N-acetylglucosaminyl deacetylase
MTKSVIYSVLLGLLVFLPNVQAQVEPELGQVALHQAVLDLGTDLSLMCVAAHPDDEDGATLTYYRKKFGYKTYALLATRGEGGQNEIGSELYEELGVIRTDEMSRASAHTGAELHFLDYAEYGYSKSADEAFAVWGKDETIRRMVRKIRELRPDVIITNHGETGGHGHHQAVGRALVISFDMAADPNAFPEQIAEGLKPWQPARLYQRGFRGGGGGGVKVPYSELDPVRGVTYAQIAAKALGEHETQGMGMFIDRFLTSRSSGTYRLLKEVPGGTQGGGDWDAPGGDLFAGLKDRVMLEARALSQKGMGVVSKENALNQLWREKGKPGEARANRLAVAKTETYLTTKVSDKLAVPGQELTIQVEFKDYGDSDADSVDFSLNAAPWMNIDEVAGKNVKVDADGFATTSFKVTISEDQEQTIPHPQYLFKPHFLEPQFTVTANAMVGQQKVRLDSEVLIDIAPKIEVEFLNAPYLIQQASSDKTTINLLVTNHTPGDTEATVDLSAGKGITLDQEYVSLSFDLEDEQKLVTISGVVDSNAKADDYALNAQVRETGHRVENVARVVDLKIPSNKNVAVIYSYDDTFVDTLERMGVPHETLDVDDFTATKLDEFTTIIVDIRAYLVRPDLVANNQTLLDYVERGGSLLVMYQKTFEWKNHLAPYDLQVGRSRVTVEEAPIKILVPDHPLFNSPNKIGDTDWDGWRQERGLYFPSRWADNYTALIDVRDPGESPPPGSCLVTKHGKGTYMYTALGWYRQLREVHPGTMRVFANMLAL